MFCPKCGTQNPEDGRFCRTCGADLGNVAAALSGKPDKRLREFGMLEPVQPINMIDRRGRPVSWESALGKLAMGVAFLVIAIALGISGKGGSWWFWMLIPAFAMFASGLGQYIQLKKSEQRGSSLAPQNTQNIINPAPPNNALPPTQTDYVAPPRASIYDTGELAERPGSVTENTTRHLELDSEGETMTLPKKP
jgi:hypothetical protein